MIRRSDRVRLGLRGRLLLLALPVVNAAFLGVWFASTTSSREALVSEEQANLALRAESLARTIGETLEDAHADALTTARLDLAAQVLDTGDPKALGWYADELVRTKKKYVAIVVADVDGRISGGNTLARNGRKVDLRGRKLEHISERRSLGESSGNLILPQRPAFLSDVLNQSEGAVGFELPIRDVVEEEIGNLVVFVGLDHLAASLAAATRAASLAIVADGAGRPVVLPPDLASDPAWRSATVPIGGGGRWRSPAGQNYYFASAKLPGTQDALGWEIVTMTTAEALEAPVATLGHQLALAILLAVVLTTAGILMVSSRIVRPIHQLIAGIEKAEKGSDLEAVDIDGADEIRSLGRAFNGMAAAVRGYQQGLEEKVRQVSEAKQEVSDILDHMGQAVFTIGNSGKINGEFSAHTKQVFGDVPIAGRSALELLQITPEKNLEAHSRMNFWLEHIIGTDEFQWMISSHEGVKSIDYVRPNSGGEIQRLELEYVPVYRSGTIERVMVMAKDLTEIARLEEEVERKERENQKNLDLIAEINGVDPSVFDSFLTETRWLLSQCDATVVHLESAQDTRGAVAKLFRLMHTIKGNARTFKISTVQDLAHTLETDFEALRALGKVPDGEAIARVKGAIAELRRLMDEFEELGSRVLGARARRAPIDMTKAVALQRAFRSFSEKVTVADPDARASHDALAAAVDAATQIPLADLFDRFRVMVGDLGTQLGKRLRDLEVSGENIMVGADLAARVGDALTHALSNAVDHGIEHPDERIRAAKPDRGVVAVRAYREEEKLAFEIEDDGRGIDPGRVKEKAIEKGLRPEHQLAAMSNAEIIELVFEPGFSTRAGASAVSGRGVGMDIVRSAMKEINGSAAIRSTPGVGTVLRLEVPVANGRG